MSEQPHKIQASILSRLLQVKTARLSELNSAKIPTDTFTSHLNSLVHRGYVQKVNGIYLLSTKGKEFAEEFHTAAQELSVQIRVGVMITARYKEDQKTWYLCEEYLKGPLARKIGLLEGEVFAGEGVMNAAERVFEEKTGTNGSFRLLGTQHIMTVDTEGHLLEDTFFYVLEALEIKGELIKGTTSVQNIWMREEELLSTSLFEHIPEALSWLDREDLSFSEREYSSN